jgi:hypothetical protein
MTIFDVLYFIACFFLGLIIGEVGNSLHISMIAQLLVAIPAAAFLKLLFPRREE